VYKKLNPGASERRLVLIGQASTALLVGFGLLWIPLMQLISAQLYQYLQSVQAYIAPPIAAVFLLGILWRRVNASGAMAALVTGFVLGVLRLVSELNKDSLSGWLLSYASINFLHFAILLFAICTAVLILVSLVTAPPPLEKVDGMTFDTTRRETLGPRGAGWRRADIVLSVLLAACVGAVWLYFS
jgi:SSS family solute:Na+ symporter